MPAIACLSVSSLRIALITSFPPGRKHFSAARTRLEAAGRRLADDHEPLRRQVAVAVAAVRAADSPPSDEDVETILEIILELIGALSRHRQRGSDFVWEAYDVDIGSH